MFVVGPLLVDLSEDLGVTVGQAGQLVAFTAIPAAILALVIGPLSDAYGRRPTLIAGAVVLGLASIGSALAPSFEVLAATRVLSGAGAAAMAPAVFAAVADLFPYAERSRIYGYILGATTVASIGGIPAATLLAAFLDWRWSFALVGIVTLGTVVALLRLYPKTSSGAPGSSSENEATVGRPGNTPATRDFFRAAYTPVLRTPGARAILGSSFVMSVGSTPFQTYLGAFFITTYGVSTADLAPILGLGGIGVLIGSQLAGRFGNQLGQKRVMAVSVLVAGVIAIIVLSTITSVPVATLINFIVWLPMGMRFTSASTIISEAVPTARGTMNALNAAFFNAGTVIGAFVGGLIVENSGYEPLGPMMLAGAIGSAALVWLFVVETPLNQPAEPEYSRIAT
jgi:DHA1 family inner membrane transport protein